MATVNNAVMICCYDRLEYLKKVIESIKQLNPSKWYFHVDGVNKRESIDVMNYINDLDINKAVLHTTENIGCSKSFYKLFKYIADREERFFVFEDDIVLEDGEGLNEELNKLNGILKFGECNQELAHYWGWGIDSATAKKVLSIDFKYLDDPIKTTTLEPLFWEATSLMYREGMWKPWDEELFLAVNYLGIKQTFLKPRTKHIGEISSRLNNNVEKQKPFYKKYVNGKLVN